MADRIEISEFLDWLKQTLRAHQDIEEVILFGSFARGDHSRTSDIDLAFRLANQRNWGAIATKIRETARTLRKLDLINLGTISEEFKAKILSEGKIIYDRSKNKTKP